MTTKSSSEQQILGEAVCPYCGVGCRLVAEGRPGTIFKVRGAPAAAANLGRICAKGATLPQVIDTPDRLSRPLVRTDRSRPFEPAAWDSALDFLATRWRRILHQYGPRSVAFYGSGQLDSETGYLVGKLFKGHMGSNNTDSNSRLCMAAAVAGYRTSLGSDGPPTCYDDIDHADLVLIVGSNMAEAHPVTFDRLKARKREHPSLQIVVIDPRRTATAEVADLHVPVRPGGDIALLNAVARILVEHGALERAFIQTHTTGFPDFARFLMKQSWSDLVAGSGLAELTLHRLAELIGRSKALLSFYCMGLNQSTVGMWKNNALINLHLLTGQIGKPGAGPFSLTGQPNAMGGREVGLLAHQLPGYRFVEDAGHRAEVEAFWELPAGRIAPEMGLTAVEMFRALETGRLKAIWIAATNPMVSLPDLHHVRRALAKAELVIVQDIFHPTETTRMADVLLPVASWGERESVSTNSERMVSLSQKLVEPPGEALPDWEIVARIARRLGYSGFDHGSGSEVWDEYIRLSRGGPCDVSGVPAERLRRESVQWPCPSVEHPGSKRRYLDHSFPTSDGRAIFWARDHRPPRETPDHEFPFILTTGRIYAHWHSMTRTGKSPKLMARDPDPYVEIHESDAARLGLTKGEVVQLTSRRGTVQLPVRPTRRMPEGMLFIPFHWGDLFGAATAANYLTISAIGRVAKQPELKYCAVNVEKAAARPAESDDARIWEQEQVCT